MFGGHLVMDGNSSTETKYQKDEIPRGPLGLHVTLG